MQMPRRNYHDSFLWFEAVLQCDGTVENRGAGGAVADVGAEISQPQKLEVRRSVDVSQHSLDLAACDDFQRAGIEALYKILAA